MKVKATALALLTGIFIGGASDVHGQSLRGSRSKMLEQNRIAREHGFTFLETSADVQQYVALGYLVPLKGNPDYVLHEVSHPYVRPETWLFVNRLTSQYRSACNSRPVYTSGTRPLDGQPPNAHPISVHPTGMAVDIRRPNGNCRTWLEKTLRSLMRAQVISATREVSQPHYHVAVYPRKYVAYVESNTGKPVRLPGKPISTTSR